MAKKTDGDETASNVAFSTRGRESAVEFVVNQIKKLLMSGSLEPGSRLPSETELAEQFGVSRGPIREAMKVLHALGVIRIVRGDGTYITDTPGDEIYNPLIFNLILSRPTKNELLALRETIELGIERLIIKNARDEDIERIELANSEMTRLVKRGADPAELTAADLEFHRSLGAAAGNRPLARIYSMVMEYLTPLIEETHRQRRNGSNAVRLHTAIIEAIRERDGNAARAAIERSVEHWAARFDA